MEETKRYAALKAYMEGKTFTQDELEADPLVADVLLFDLTGVPPCAGGLRDQDPEWLRLVLWLQGEQAAREERQRMARGFPEPITFPRSALSGLDT